MDRRKVIAAGIASGLVSGIAAAAGPALAQGDDYRDEPKGGDGSDYGHAPDDRDRPYGGPADHPVGTYSRDEIVHSVSDFFGVTAENAGAVIEKVFHENGRPTAYIAGQEGSGAFFFGLRYGRGLMYMKDRPHMDVFWQGPTGGFDWGGNASRVFTLCYNLQYPDAIFRPLPRRSRARPILLVGGLGMNYQRADGIVLAPVRAGVGFRLGASLGYLAYSRQRNVIPL